MTEEATVGGSGQDLVLLSLPVGYTLLPASACCRFPSLFFSLDGFFLTVAMLKNSESHSYLVLENFIGGKFSSCRNHIDSYDPSTGEVYCKVPDSGKEEVGEHCLLYLHSYFY